jgi:ComF family protein
MKHSFKDYILDLFLPKFCFGCGKEGNYLCEDCLAVIEILERNFCPGCQKVTVNGETCPSCKKSTKLNGLYFSTSYQNNLVKKMITQFKYEPLIRELKKPLADLIITHFQLCEKTKSYFADFVLVPVPLEIKRMKWRGFNQSEEIAKELAKYLEIPVISDSLFKTKETLPQMELNSEEREENIKGAFLVKNIEKIVRKRILLVDDVYTTGSTMNECARALKDAGAREVWGVAVARE